MATNPPITIGPFANVPAPGSAGKSDWCQQVSHYVSEQLARGLVARPADVTVDQTGISAAADLTGLTTTFTVVAGRWYRVSFVVPVSQVSAVGSEVIFVSLDGAVHPVSYAYVGLAGAQFTHAASLVFVGGAQILTLPFVAAGSWVVKLRGSTSGGTMTVAGASLANARLWIEDIGSTVAVP